MPGFGATGEGNRRGCPSSFLGGLTLEEEVLVELLPVSKPKMDESVLACTFSKQKNSSY